MSRYFIAAMLLVAGAAGAQESSNPNPYIDYAAFQENVRQVGELRQARLVTEAQFKRMAKDRNTVILDARSAMMYGLLHIKGAKNLSFPDITAEELASEPLILGEKGGNTRRLIDLFFEKNKLEPKIVMELQRTEAIIKMVERGFGVTILPRRSVNTQAARGTLHAVPVRDLDVKWEFVVAYLMSEYLPPALESFLKLCRAYIGGEGHGVSGE